MCFMLDLFESDCTYSFFIALKTKQHAVWCKMRQKIVYTTAYSLVEQEAEFAFLCDQLEPTPLVFAQTL